MKICNFEFSEPSGVRLVRYFHRSPQIENAVTTFLVHVIAFENKYSSLGEKNIIPNARRRPDKFSVADGADDTI